MCAEQKNSPNAPAFVENSDGLCYNKILDIVNNSRRIVFFGGAGVSTESGIPDFRSADGLYHQKYDVPPEVMLSASYFYSHTEKFFEFYREKMLPLWAKPNAAHIRLAQWERAGKLLAVVTQNIDGLHQAAGSKRVFELHGSIHRNHCLSCGKAYSAQDIVGSRGIPRCSCGGIIKPDVVLYEEPLDQKTIEGAIQAISEADTLIVAGTSLTVYPAASFVDFFRGKNLVLINRDPTPLDKKCTLVLHEKVGEVFAALPSYLPEENSK